MMKHWFAACAAALLSLAWLSPAHAGRSCEAPKPPSAQVIEQGMNLAERTLKALDAEHAKSGAKVVVLARAGQDLSKYNLRYSHLGFAYKTPEGRWLVAHKLNTCGTAEASLYRQGLGEFFLDDLFRYEAAWIVPTREVQDKLHPALLDNRRLAAMHIKPYNMVSYVWGTRYQQSNQWAIETLASAMESSIKTRDPEDARLARERAQAWLQFKGFEPTTLNIPPLTRLGGRITAANIAFDDHPNQKRFSDRIETVTVDSVFAWMQRSGLGAAPVALKL
jgi:hypothetical protein